MKTRDVIDELYEKHGEKSGIVSIGMGLQDNYMQSKQMKSIRAKVTPDYDGELPTQVDRIPINTEKYKEPTPDSCPDPSQFCDTEDHDPVPGGSQLMVDHPDLGDCLVTATCKVDNNGHDRLMTTGHAFLEDSIFFECDEFNSWHVYQGSSEDYVGYNTSRTDHHRDFALVREAWSSGISGFTDEVKTSSNSTVEVRGNYTEESLYNMQGDEITKYGARTCKEEGPLDYINPHAGRCHSEPDVTWIEADPLYSSDGDSGAPYFDTWTDTGGCTWASIIAIHFGTPDDDPYESTGCAAFEIANHPDWTIEFGSDWDGPCAT